MFKSGYMNALIVSMRIHIGHCNLPFLLEDILCSYYVEERSTMCMVGIRQCIVRLVVDMIGRQKCKVG